MRLLFLTLLVLLGTALAVQVVAGEPGYVLIAVGTTSIEMSLAVFSTLTALAFILLYVLLRSLVRAWRLYADLGALRERRHLELARKRLTKGLIELAEGRWAAAERLLLRSARRSETPLLNYLAAARAAQMQQAYDRRDEYLRWAIESDISADIAVGLSQAELQLEHAQNEQALATLHHLNELSPSHDYVLRLLSILYRRMEDWSQLFELLPRLNKRKVFDEDTLLDMEQAAVLGQIRHHAQRGEHEALETLWHDLPRVSRQRPELIRAYASALAALQETDKAEVLLRTTLDRDWDEDLAYRYGQLNLDDAGKVLAHAESWLKEYGRSPMLLLTLGRLCRRARLWGKARIYFESSLGLKPLPETYQELATLLHQMGHDQQADECYRKGLKLAVEGIAEPLATVRKTSAGKALTPVPLQQPDIYSV